MITFFKKRISFNHFEFLNFKNILLFSIFSLFAISCNDSLVDTPNPIDGGPRIEPRTTAADTLDYFVKALTKAQSDVDVRNFIKTAAVNNPWDDNALVYAMEYDVVVKNSLTLAAILYNSRDVSDSRFGSNFFSRDIFIEYPTLSIYLYTGDEDLDLGDFNASTAKDVFQIPDDHTAIDSITVYKWKTLGSTPGLETYKIHSTTEPTQQFLCVGANSSLIAIETDNFTLYPGGLTLEERMGFPPLCEDLLEAIVSEAPITITIYGQEVVLFDPSTILSLWCSLCDDGSSPICNEGGGGGDPCLSTCDRDCRENRDGLVKYHVNLQSDLDKMCSWTRKWCSFTIHSIYAINPGSPAIGDLIKTDRAQRLHLKGWNGRWWTPSSELLFFDWDLHQLADPMKYYWICLNPKAGKERTTTIGFSGKFKVPGTTEVGVTGSTAVKYTEKDFPCYEDLIYYCDPASGDGTRYNTGSVSFFIKEKE